MTNYINMIAAIKTALKRKNSYIDVYSSKIAFEVLNILTDLGFIYGYSKLKNYKVRIFLKYSSKVSVIQTLYVVSKPSKKVYLKKIHLLKTLNNKNQNFTLLLTSKGVITEFEAILFGIGGIPLLYID